MSQRCLIDAGPIVAMLASSEEAHVRCVERFSELRKPVLTCWPVITEAAWILRRSSKAIDNLFAILMDRTFEILPLGEDDLPDISAILTKYRDLRVQLADAALLHLANRESIDTIFTLDRRDFEVFRLRSGKRPRLIP